jgi:ferredoxin-NADP reductase
MILSPLRRTPALPFTGLLRQLSSPLDPDAYLSLLNPRWGTRLRGVIERVEPVTAEAASLTIRPGRAWTGHLPGQFVTVGVDVDGVRHHRCYSLTSPAGDPRSPIEITVQATEAGVVSNHLVHRARPGDVVQLSTAEGEFTLPGAGGDGSREWEPIAPLPPLLFVTGGSGLTPVIGMLRTLSGSATAPDVVLLHHATDPGRCLFLDELERLDRHHDWLRVVTTFTRSGDRPASRFGLTRLDVLCPDWREREVYACGPEPLLDAVEAHCTGAGASGQVHTERFVLGRQLPADPSAGDEGVARFASSAIEVPSDGATPLLELAEQAGLAPASGCRMGICHTCSTRLEQGCVRDLRDGRLLESGQHVQVCVSAAVGDVTLDL